MTTHIAIRRDRYVAGTGDRPEVGIFTQTHATRPPVPWGRIAVADTVYMKWSGGPMVARASVQGFRQFHQADAVALRQATVGYGLHDVNDYWTELPPIFFAVVIYLEHEEWLNEPIEPARRSFGESWIVCATDEDLGTWLTPAAATTFAQGTASRVTERRSRGSRTIPASLRFAVFRRDSFTCRYCGRRAPEVRLHADHRIAWSRGGPTTLDNLWTACDLCNVGKGAQVL